MWNYRNKIRLAVSGIFILILAAAALDFPQYLGPVGLNLPQLPFHLGLDLQGGTHLLYEADVTKIEPGQEASALAGVRDVIERRVNAFGVAEPLVQTAQVGNNWRVVVELAGISDINQAIKMIGETPLLEFKEPNPNPTTTLTEEQKQQLTTADNQAKTQAEEILAQALKPDADFAALAQQYSQDTGSATNGGDIGFQLRGALVPEFEKVCFDELKIGEIAKTLTKTQFGYHIIKKIGEQGSGDNYQARCRHILFTTPSAQSLATLQDQWLNTKLTGINLKRASVQFDSYTQVAEVALEFDSEGAKLFADITHRNLGKPVAIFLDGQPISTPTVQNEITNGQAVISGKFSVQEAKLLAQRLNAGALPVPINLISQETIGSSLGQIALKKSLIAGLIGLIAVSLFMIFFYRLPGVVAAIALIGYGFMILAIFKLIPVTITLAGVAGFVLSLGMAVDANVLIFERTKEELRKGKILDIAVKEGFNRAWPSIRDSNISSLITCFILMTFSTSLIKGFAITLTIGIIISMISAILVTRSILQLLITVSLFKHPWLFGVKKSKIQI